jgi:cytochrome P450
VTTPLETPLFFNPFDPDFRINPYPVYKRFLEEDPWHVSPLGMTVLSRYDDVVGLLRHANASSDGSALADESMRQQARESLAAQGVEVDPAMENMQPFLFMDPPDHTRLRGLVQKAFTPRAIEGLRPRVAEIVDELLDRALEAGRMEAVEDFAYQVPVQIISEMLGVPHEDHETFKGWSRILAKSLDPEFVAPPPEVMATRARASLAFVEYFRGLIAERRKSPGDDILTALVAAEEAGDKLTEPELLSTLIILLVAGHETTVNLIANSILAVGRDHALQADWRGDPAVDKSAIEEVLRLDPPVQFTGRGARADIELPSGTLKEGEFAITLLGAANRDPSHFTDPDRFDVRRADNRHLAFGFGIHHCIGAPLARIEGQVALAKLLRRTREITLDLEQPAYKDNIILRGLDTLPVTLTPA